MKELPLATGQVTYVDDEDFDFLSQWVWRANKKRDRIYVERREGRRHIYLHRLLAQAPDGLMVDHINGNPLDNRRSNLRVVSQSVNQWNTPARRKGKSGYKGVNYEPRRGKWSVYLRIGTFDTAEAAARAYDHAVSLLRDDYAFRNFGNEQTDNASR